MTDDLPGVGDVTEPDYLAAAVESALEMRKQRAKRDFYDRFKKEAGARVPVLRQERDEAIWHLFHDAGMSAVAIADALTAALVEQGTPGAGVSHDTVRNIANRPGNET
jgi:hypothetical protein